MSVQFRMNDNFIDVQLLYSGGSICLQRIHTEPRTHKGALQMSFPEFTPISASLSRI